MSRAYDPLNFIPSPDVLRGKLDEAETLAGRLRILLDVSERIHAPMPAMSRTDCSARGGEAPGANAQYARPASQ